MLGQKKGMNTELKDSKQVAKWLDFNYIMIFKRHYFLNRGDERNEEVI